MQKTELEITRNLDVSELKRLAAATPPCLTLHLPLEGSLNTREREVRRLKALSRRAGELLDEMGVDSNQSEDLLSFFDTISGGAAWGGEGGTLIVVRSPDVARAFEIRQRLEERVEAGNSFYILPAIHSLNVASQVFYLLALSQKHVRLLRCTPESAEEVSLGEGAPVSVEEWLHTRLPNSAPDHRAERSESTGGSFTSTQDRDNQEEHLANFFRVINKAVVEILRGERAPLVLCGVDYERTMYRGVNTCPELAADGVQGSPESLKGSEMHARALEAVQEYFARPAVKALTLWEDVAGTPRALRHFPEIVKAAYETRIAHLFVAENARSMGVFDRERMEMSVQGRPEDLVNAAALQTLGFGGDVFLVKPEHVPGGGQLAAITRY